MKVSGGQMESAKYGTCSNHSHIHEREDHAFRQTVKYGIVGDVSEDIHIAL
jgi:hypothetical protein